MKKLILLFTLISTILVGCKKEDATPKTELKTPTLSVVCGQKSQLLVTPTADGCTFNSNQSLIASVSTTGEVKGVTIGEAIISVLDISSNVIGQCKVTVTPQHTMYKEPYLGFGANQTQIKTYETRTLLSETTKAINYKGENSNITQLAYSFENNKYVGVVCLVPISKISLLTDFLLERYIPVGVGSGDILAAFVSVDKKTTVGIFYYSTSYVGSMYISFTESKSTVNFYDIANEIIKSKKALISIPQ